MINMYASKDSKLEKIDTLEDGAWISLVNPNENEINHVASLTNVDIDFIKAALDEEERSRIELDHSEGTILIVVDVPFKESKEELISYVTFPLGIIFTEKGIITVSLKNTIVLEGFENNSVKTFYTYKKSRFILQILYRNATLYLQYLKQVNNRSSDIEEKLHKSMKNKELIQLMGLEKSLVYFSTSLVSNELVMEKLLRYEFLKKYPEDTELLEDTIIENKQAIEMAKIYSDILSGTMDAFASIISNNLNIVMKFLATITIVMSIPTMISGFFGMNVLGIPFANNPHGFVAVFIITVAICAFIAYIMAKKDMF